MEALILTKSRMKSHGVSGVCTTAYDLEHNRLLRFVSNPDGAPIGNPYNNAYECLDIVDVNILRDCPIKPQTENVLVDPTSFKRIRKYNGNLLNIFEKICRDQSNAPQYMNDSTHKLMSVDKYNHSLEIKKVSNLILKRTEWGKTVASFQADIRNGKYGFSYYNVTDNRYELSDFADEKEIGDAYIIVSIPYKPYERDSCFYKLIAAIYPI